METNERIERFRSLWEETTQIEDALGLLEEEIEEDDFQPKWIDTIEVAESRWYMHTLEIVEVDDGVFLGITWDRGKTERQENYYGNSRVTLVRPIEKVVSTIEWKTIKDV